MDKPLIDCYLNPYCVELMQKNSWPEILKTYYSQIYLPENVKIKLCTYFCGASELGHFAYWSNNPSFIYEDALSFGGPQAPGETDEDFRDKIIASQLYCAMHKSRYEKERLLLYGNRTFKMNQPLFRTLERLGFTQIGEPHINSNSGHHVITYIVLWPGKINAL